MDIEILDNKVVVDNINYTIFRLDDILKQMELYDKIREGNRVNVNNTLITKLKDLLEEVNEHRRNFNTEQELTDVIYDIIINTISEYIINTPFNKKIDALLVKMVDRSDLSEDYQIVLKIKEEFEQNKKINQSTIMYLNKLHKITK
jgi:undecaprenyl pyrophosphate phosphatase UppP